MRSKYIICMIGCVVCMLGLTGSTGVAYADTIRQERAHIGLADAAKLENLQAGALQENEDAQTVQASKAVMQENAVIRKAKKKRQESRKSRRILERIVEAEAGDQSYRGRLLVACVILNRVDSPQFPDTVEKVVFAPGQFSPVSNGRYYSVTVSRTTKNAVAAALKGEDPSQGALYFMDRRYSDPDAVAWFDRALTPVMKWQGHEFYR